MSRFLSISLALAFCSTAGAFQSAHSGVMRHRTSGMSQRSVLGSARTKMSEMSKAVPFMPQPVALDGSMSGDVGFDPLNISGVWFNLDFLREAELKHGRVCMLAVPGWIMTEYVHFPGYAAFNTDALHAHALNAPFGGLMPLLVFCATLELYGGAALVEMMRGSGRKAGDFGFDPIGFSGPNADPALVAKYELAELKNGRLAMLAYSGIVTACTLTGKTTHELLFDTVAGRFS